MRRLSVWLLAAAAAVGPTHVWAADVAKEQTAVRGHGTCVVAGKKVSPFVVDVAPKGASPFKLRVEGLAAEVATGGLEQPALVTVRTPLAFVATVAADGIPARTRRTVDAFNGMVRLAPATEKLTLHAALRSRQVDATVRLGGVELRGLILPCDALTLDDVTPPNLQLVEGEGGEHFAPAGKLLHWRTGPGQGPTMEVAVDEPQALDLRRTEEHGDWVRVTTRWPDGTTLAGWVRRQELAAPSGHGLVGDNLPLAATCTLGPTTRGAERIVDAPVATGTEVYAARYLGPWAKVADGSKLRLRVRPKDDWVEIVVAPGLASVTECASSTVLLDAWVPRAAAKLPAEVAPAAPSDGGAGR
jgi:hypothetical protein